MNCNLGTCRTHILDFFVVPNKGFVFTSFLAVIFRHFGEFCARLLNFFSFWHAVLRFRIRDPVLFWPLYPVSYFWELSISFWVKISDPNPGSEMLSTLDLRSKNSYPGYWIRHKHPWFATRLTRYSTFAQIDFFSMHKLAPYPTYYYEAVNYS
jgi:hypothetical protein